MFMGGEWMDILQAVPHRKSRKPSGLTRGQVQLFSLVAIGPKDVLTSVWKSPNKTVQP